MRLLRPFLLVTSLLLFGCATGSNANPQDPLEPLNRSIYKFNDAVDSAVLKPVAKGYQAAVPSPIRTGINNFFGNIGELWSAFNHLLQFEFQNAGQTVARFGINTFLGLGGILDIATDAGIQKRSADFGQTLGRWGVPSGPYVMLPIFGPSSVRDSAGFLADISADPVANIHDNVGERNRLQVTRIVDTRSQLLGASDVMDGVALDRYTFLRDAYLQRRQSQTMSQAQKDAASTAPDDETKPEKEERYDLEESSPAPPTPLK